MMVTLCLGVTGGKAELLQVGHVIAERLQGDLPRHGREVPEPSTWQIAGLTPTAFCRLLLLGYAIESAL